MTGVDLSRRRKHWSVCPTIVALGPLEPLSPRRIADCDLLAKPCNHVMREALG